MAPRVSGEDPSGDENRGERDQLAAEHDPVHIDRGLPGDRPSFDDPRAAGPRLKAVAASLFRLFAGVFADPTSGTAADQAAGMTVSPFFSYGSP